MNARKVKLIFAVVLVTLILGAGSLRKLMQKTVEPVKHVFINRRIRSPL